MVYAGLNKHNGYYIKYSEHLQQSVADIITTPIGSRVMRRDYGSYVFALIDSAANAYGLQQIKAAIACALIRWEPRLQLTHIEAYLQKNGRLAITIQVKFLEALEKKVLEKIDITVANPTTTTFTQTPVTLRTAELTLKTVTKGIEKLNQQFKTMTIGVGL